MAEERFISKCDLSSSSFSFSNSSADSTASSASSDDMTDSGNFSWGFLPPLIPHGGPLFHMKSLRDSLPSRKRGLSHFFSGKSQSFTCVADVKCVEDLAKPVKKIKGSRSWEPTVKSSYNNRTSRMSIFLAGSGESMKIPRKTSYGSKTGKKNGRLIPTKPERLPL